MRLDCERLEFIDLVDKVIADHHLHFYQEDLYSFDDQRGIYQRLESGAVRGLLLADLEEHFPRRNVSSGAMSNLMGLLTARTFLKGDIDPPFHVPSRQPLRVIVCRNGVIDLDQGSRDGRWELCPHSPDIFALGAVDYCYEPDAQCPKFDAVLNRVSNGDPEVARMVIEFTASVFARPDIAFEAVLWLKGRGRDGKSTLFRALRHVIGEDVTSAVGLEAFSSGNTFRTWPLLHKVANFASDAVIDSRSNFAALNSWVSRDPVTVHRKFRDSVTVIPKAVLFFASNADPVADDPSDAFWRRIRLVNCVQQVDERDVNAGLTEELFEEAPGILNRILAALPVIEEAKTIFMPEAVRKNVQEIRASVGSFREYAFEELEAGAETDYVFRENLLVDYRHWAIQKNLPLEDIRRIRSEMMRLFGSRDHRRRVGEDRTRVYVWSGVRQRDHRDRTAYGLGKGIRSPAAAAALAQTADGITSSNTPSCNREPEESISAPPNRVRATPTEDEDDDYDDERIDVMATVELDEEQDSCTDCCSSEGGVK